MADKELDVDTHGTVTGRVNATDSPINNASISVDPRSTRLKLSGSAGLSSGFNIGNSHIIGSAGVEASAAGNLAASTQTARERHDFSTDRTRPNAVGAYEAQDVLHEVIAKTGGHLGQYKVGEALDLIKRHPNIITEKSRAHIGKIEDGLQSVSYTPPSGLPQAQQEATALYQSFQLNVASHLSPKVDNAIDKLYNATQSPSLNTGHTLADPVMNLKLSDINQAASRAHDFLAAKASPGVVENLVGSANDRLTSVGQQTLPADITAKIDGAVSRADNILTGITRQYANIPSAAEIVSDSNKLDRVIKIDPRIEASLFAAAAVINPLASAAVVAKETAALGVGNIDKAAGDPVQVHPAIIKSLRAEAVVVGDKESFSLNTGRELDLKISRSETKMGGYVFAEQDKMHWMRMDGSRTTTTAGLGASVTRPTGNDTSVTVSAEAFTGHINDVSPGTNLRQKNNGAAVTVGFKF